MTASWGGLGVLWNANVSFAFVRPSRYTFEFLEREKYYTLSFLGLSQRRALQICGSKSGRDTDKVAEAGLTPVFDAPAPARGHGVVFFRFPGGDEHPFLADAIENVQMCIRDRAGVGQNGE